MQSQILDLRVVGNKANDRAYFENLLGRHVRHAVGGHQLDQLVTKTGVSLGGAVLQRAPAVLPKERRGELRQLFRREGVRCGKPSGE